MSLHAVMIAGLTWFQVFRIPRSFGKELEYINAYIFFLLPCLLLLINMNSLTIRMVILVFGAAEDAKHALGPVPLCRNADGYFRG